MYNAKLILKRVFENWYPQCYRENVLATARQRHPMTQIYYLPRPQGLRLRITWWKAIRIYNGNIKKSGNTSLKTAPRKEKIIWIFFIRIKYKHKIHSLCHMLVFSAADTINMWLKKSLGCCIKIIQGVRKGDIHERTIDLALSSHTNKTNGNPAVEFTLKGRIKSTQNLIHSRLDLETGLCCN